MPFESRSQMKKCFAMESKGTAGSWNCKKWAAETPNMNKLPNFKGASPHTGWRTAHMARHGIKC